MKNHFKFVTANICEIELDTEVYDKEAVFFASYKFTQVCYFRFRKNCEHSIFVIIEMKEFDSNNNVIKKIVGEFLNELIDQQIRLILEREFKSIKEVIIKTAFAPIYDKINDK